MEVLNVEFLPECNKVEILVYQDPHCYMVSRFPHLPYLLFDIFPYMREHKCFNNRRKKLWRESLITEIPHLFEHVYLAIHGHMHIQSDNFGGNTDWNWYEDPAGIFRVEVGFWDEVVLFPCIRLAELLINALAIQDYNSIDLPYELKHLSKIAEDQGGIPNSYFLSYAEAIWSDLTDRNERRLTRERRFVNQARSTSESYLAAA